MTRVRSPRWVWTTSRTRPQGIHPQRDESLLAGCIGVFDRESYFIAKRLLGMCKANTVLAKIAACLDRVKFKLHLSIMHI